MARLWVALFVVNAFALSPLSLFSDGRDLRFQANNGNWVQSAGVMDCSGSRTSPAAKIAIHPVGSQYTFVDANNLYLCQVYYDGYIFISPALSIPNELCYFSITQLADGKITIQSPYNALYWGNGYYHGGQPVMATPYNGGLSEFLVEAFAEFSSMTVAYQTNIAQILNLPMVFLLNKTVTNYGSVQQESDFAFNEQTTTTMEWTWESSVTVSEELTASAEIPELGEFGSTTTVSTTITYGQVKTLQETNTWADTIITFIPPNQTYLVTASVQQGQLNLPFIATISYVGETYTDIVQGTYTAVAFFNLQESTGPI